MLRHDGTSEVYFGSHFGHFTMLVVFCNLLEKTIDYLTRTHVGYCFKERKVLLVMDNYVVNY